MEGLQREGMREVEREGGREGGREGERQDEGWAIMVKYTKYRTT